MLRFTSLTVVLAASAVIGMGISVRAASLNYNIAAPTPTTVVTPGDPGLVIQTAINPFLDSIEFDLDDGQSATFEFFEIWSNETAINTDDIVPNSISATMAFDIPSGASATINGTTVAAGHAIHLGFLGTVVLGQTGASVTWGAPADIVTADREFTVSLNDTTFNSFTDFLGIGHYVPGESFAGDVDATITQISSVPTPAAALGGTVLLGAVGFSQLRRRYCGAIR